ncbi:hypothetical protein K3495_g1384 [Podosphaera aphanis]|nr:hypothetical protein K3495_g1384 [Podosphaera aphanis]
MRAPKEPTREELLADRYGIPDSDSSRPGSPAWSKSTVMSMLSVAMSALDTASSCQANRAASRLGLDDDDDDLDPFQALEKKGYHWDTFDEAAAAYAADEHEYGSRAAWAPSTPQLSDFWWTAWVSRESTEATAVATTAAG